MRKVYASFTSVLVCLTAFSAEVTFNVDMSNEVVSPNGVHLAGSFGNDGYPQWSPNGIELTDANVDGIYSVTLSLNGPYYEFKFINGSDWPFEEDVPNACQVEVNGNSNRFVNVNGDSSVDVCFANCAACGDFAVRFRVDMSIENEGIGINPLGVHVAGSFQGWNPGATILTDANNDLIFETIYTIPSNGANTYDLIFKYINGNDWPFPNENVPAECGDGSGNRFVTLTSLNTVLDAYCFNSCTSCVAPTMVTLSVDMSNETVSPNGVHVAGAFQGWNPGATELTDPDMDNIYSITLALQPGTYQYKFVNGNDWGGVGNDNESLPSECNVNGNRQIDVVGETMEVAYCYNQCSAECEAYPDPAAITFRVNMEEVEVSAEGVFVIGNFTDPQWQGGATQMTDDDSDGIYEATLVVSGPAEIFYKFVNGNVSVTANEENSGLETCGVANGIGGFNRVYTRSGAPETLDVVCFNQCLDCGVSVQELNLLSSSILFPNPSEGNLSVLIPEGAESTVTITIFDATGAMISSVEIRGSAAGTIETLDLHSLAKGVYIAELSSKGKSARQRFIIQ
jgi:hypothetical protein